MPEKNPHENRRARVQARVDKIGFEGMADHEALEYLLFYVIPRKDTNPLAHELVERFGSFSGVLDADEKDLQTVPGVGVRAAQFLHGIKLATAFYAMSRRQSPASLKKCEDAVRYAVPLFEGLVNERMYMVMLDDQYCPMQTVLLAEGQPGALQVDMTVMARRAVASGATQAMICHNHPRGVPMPSHEDISTTRQISKTLGILGIGLVDHVIVARGMGLSLRECGKMPYYDPLRGEVDY